jgi:hypothetical protein
MVIIFTELQGNFLNIFIKLQEYYYKHQTFSSATVCPLVCDKSHCIKAHFKFLSLHQSYLWGMFIYMYIHQ